MEVFDLKALESHTYQERARNIFYQASNFKARVIELPAGGEMPTCEMDSYVVFTVIKGKALVIVDGEKRMLEEGQCMITEPATLSLSTEQGVRIMGIQIQVEKGDKI